MRAYLNRRSVFPRSPLCEEKNNLVVLLVRVRPTRKG